MALFLLSTGFSSMMPIYIIPWYPRCSQESSLCTWLADVLFSFTSPNFPKESFLALLISSDIVISGGTFLFFLPCFFGTILEWHLPCFDLNMVVIVKTSLMKNEMSLYCGLSNNFMYFDTYMYILSIVWHIMKWWAEIGEKVRFRKELHCYCHKNWRMFFFWRKKFNKLNKEFQKNIVL